VAITFGGLSSGLDTSSIIDSLVQLQSAPIVALQKRQAGVRSQVSLVGDIASRLSALESAAKALGAGGVVAHKATSTNTAFTAAPGTGAAAGSFRVAVTQLAQAAKGRSDTFATGETVQGGTLSLTVQDRSFTITVDPDSTLEAVAEKLRATGAVSVAVLATDQGRVLSLASTATGVPLTGPGVALELTHSVSGAGTKALGFVIPAGQEARNARFTVDGLEFTRTSNVVSDAVPGTALSLKQQGGPAETLVVESDLAATREKLQTFVDAYNAVMKLVQNETKPTSATDRAKTLTGDSGIRMLATRLQGVVSSRFTEAGALRTLADVGLKTDTTTGLVSLDATALDAAMKRDPTAVNALFSTPATGVAAVTSSLVQSFTRAGDGVLTSRTSSLQNLSKKMDDDIARIQARVDAYREMLVKQFTAMEEAVSKLKASGSFLSAQESINNKKE
jgi:flagellar hook-associated protein 2